MRDNLRPEDFSTPSDDETLEAIQQLPEAIMRLLLQTAKDFHKETDNTLPDSVCHMFNTGQNPALPRELKSFVVPMAFKCLSKAIAEDPELKPYRFVLDPDTFELSWTDA